jgi:thioredoxin 1
MSIIEVSEENFALEVLKSPLPVLVDFWAPWCEPCQTVAQTLLVIAQLYESRIKVVRINTDKNRKLARRYRICGLPTVILFLKGKPIKSSLGIRAKEEYLATLQRFTSPAPSLSRVRQEQISSP